MLTDLQKSGDGGDATAAGLFKLMATKEYVSTLLLMRDVLPLLSAMSKVFQTRGNDLTIIEDTVPGVVAAIDNMIENPGQNWLRRDDVFKELHDSGVDLGGHPSRTQEWLEKQRRAYLGALRDRLQHRFPENHLLSAFSRVLHFKHYPVDPGTPCSAADEAVKTLADHFSQPLPAKEGEALVDSEKLKSEWVLFTGLYRKKCAALQADSWSRSWRSKKKAARTRTRLNTRRRTNCRWPSRWHGC